MGIWFFWLTESLFWGGGISRVKRSEGAEFFSLVCPLIPGLKRAPAPLPICSRNHGPRWLRAVALGMPIEGCEKASISGPSSRTSKDGEVEPVVQVGALVIKENGEHPPCLS